MTKFAEGDLVYSQIHGEGRVVYGDKDSVQVDFLRLDYYLWYSQDGKMCGEDDTLILRNVVEHGDHKYIRTPEELLSDCHQALSELKDLVACAEQVTKYENLINKLEELI